jgi:hypothetical protein
MARILPEAGGRWIGGTRAINTPSKRSKSLSRPRSPGLIVANCVSARRDGWSKISGNATNCGLRLGNSSNKHGASNHGHYSPISGVEKGQ